jgi:hypothetical protein
MIQIIFISFEKGSEPTEPIVNIVIPAVVWLTSDNLFYR